VKVLTDKEIEEVRRRRANGETRKALAKEFYVHEKTIQYQCRKPVVRQYREIILKRFMKVG
jgi:DNA-binding CsgD family transcriptional regulator